MNKVVILIVPHPDDLEILCGHTAQFFMNNGYKTFEVLMTGGEYGLVSQNVRKYHRFKGKLLQEIRRRENDTAKLNYGLNSDGTPRVKSIRMYYIDGHVPFNLKSVNRIMDKIESLKPSVIIGPDPVYSIDWHADHMKTAYNVYFAVRRSKQLRSLPYLVYQSFKTNLFFPEQSWDLFEHTLMAHKSQLSPFKIKILRNFLEKFYYPLKLHRIGLRKVNITNNSKIESIVDKIKYCVVSGRTPAIPIKGLYNPRPEVLGLNPDP